MVFLIQELCLDEISSNDSEHLDYWMKKQLAKKFYEDAGYRVLLGDDLENNLLLHVKNYPFLDRYTQIKTGKMDPFIVRYNRIAAEAIQEDDMIKLLYICRLCSYVGGPGVCDMILVKDGSYEMRHIIAEDSMRRETALFIFLVKFIFGLCDVKMTDVVCEKRGGTYELDAGKFFRDAIEDGLRKKQWQNLQDDMFTRRYKEKVPFFILQKWLSLGHADENDIYKNFNSMHKIIEEEKQEATKRKAELEGDSNFVSIGKGMDTVTLERKLSYIQEKYDMPKSEAIALLNRFL